MEIYAVKNDNTKVRVDDDYVLGFKITLDRFTDEFRIGRCLCMSAKLTVAKEALLSDIKGFAIKDPNEYFVIDSVDTRDDYYAVYQLTDFIAQANRQFIYDVPSTVKEVVRQARDELGLSHIETSAYTEDLPVEFCDVTASVRDFLNWVAECEGANYIARFDSTDLFYTSDQAPESCITFMFEKYSSLTSLKAVEAADITVGDALNITGVQVNKGITRVGDSEGYMYECNADNVLITNNDKTEDTLRRIYDELVNVSVCNLRMSDFETESLATVNKSIKSYSGITVDFAGNTYNSINNID